MKSSNLSNLIQDAVEYGSASASAGKWQAVCVRGEHVFDPNFLVQVFHHGTHMFDARMTETLCDASARSADVVMAVDPGYGSTSDRCGVRRITEGAYVEGIGYKELYGEG